MEKIGLLLSNHTDYLYITFYVGIAAIIVTYIVHFVTKSIKFAKYIPGIAMVFFGVLTFFSVIGKLFDENAANLLAVSMIGIGIGCISLCFALILGVINKNSSRNKDSASKYYDESDEIDY
ncbi:MAG: cytochrome C biosynthesis protein [Tissierellia bacterium]|nr:cytochrome C biosynthesis protein [Tissierellia bacterium]